MIDYKKKFSDYTEYFNDYLYRYADSLEVFPSVLKDAMVYSLLNGGKRMRPVLSLAVCDALGGNREEVLPFALALEMIHTYSLIHDDLPAMDNDDFRRGKPSSHKTFGEANAILAGDALLNTAFELSAKESVKGKRFAECAVLLSRAAGIQGMIAGQVADVTYLESMGADGQLLDFIYEHKTAKLIEVPIAVASTLCDKRYFDELCLYGRNLGHLFQLTDDILDVEGEFEAVGKTIGKDATENKLTAVRVYGLDGAKKLRDSLRDECLAGLNLQKGDFSFLRWLTDQVYSRNK